ncbi:hypothetical protein D3218_12870 [Aureimonas flava]|uniref:Uncharacterized protein n=1 Tax=Aureimonas flava TaxID=2320271 RepID=A0A3A1WS70_9HYPH|nr:hypothetical protein [Aureimonas flava]RIY00175.1 hypothetical protein D3218_12870 [Aureimonas flava]
MSADHTDILTRFIGAVDDAWGDEVPDMALLRKLADAGRTALKAYEAKIAALTAENATLREALAPFCAFANYLARAPDDLVMTRGSWIAAQQVTAGDFRRARAALRQEGKP